MFTFLIKLFEVMGDVERESYALFKTDKDLTTMPDGLVNVEFLKAFKGLRSDYEFHSEGNPVTDAELDQIINEGGTKLDELELARDIIHAVYVDFSEKPLKLALDEIKKYNKMLPTY